MTYRAQLRLQLEVSVLDVADSLLDELCDVVGEGGRRW